MSGMQMLDTSQLGQHSEPAAVMSGDMRKKKKRSKGDIAWTMLYHTGLWLLYLKLYYSKF